MVRRPLPDENAIGHEQVNYNTPNQSPEPDF